MTAETNDRTTSLREAAQMLIDANCAMLNAFTLDTKRPETIAQSNAAFGAREAITAGRAALALPDAEPVAWMDSMGNLHFRWKDALIDESDPIALFAVPQPTEPKAAA